MNFLQGEKNGIKRCFEGSDTASASHEP
jgi:hypothetical protein